MSAVTLAGRGEKGGTLAQNGTNNNITSTTSTTAQNSDNGEQVPGASEDEQPPMDFIEENTGYSDIWDVLPYIDGTPAENFEYEYTTD